MTRNLLAAHRIGSPAFRIDKTFWGLRDPRHRGPLVMLQVAQGVVLASGASCAAAALVLVTPRPR